MLREWQFNVLFIVGVGSAILILVGPEFGLNIGSNPTAVTGVGAILAYILAQKKAFTKNGEDKDPKHKKGEDDDGSA